MSPKIFEITRRKTVTLQHRNPADTTLHKWPRMTSPVVGCRHHVPPHHALRTEHPRVMIPWQYQGHDQTGKAWGLSQMGGHWHVPTKCDMGCRTGSQHKNGPLWEKWWSLIHLALAHGTAQLLASWFGSRSYGYGHVSRRGCMGRVYMQVTLCSVLFLQLCLKSKITSK